MASADAQLGEFVLQRFIAAGGGGSVWRASHRRNGTPVAIKTLPRHGEQELSEVTRLELEAHAQMAHAHVVPVYDFGWVDTPKGMDGRRIEQGSVWVAMELGQDSLQGRPPTDWQTLETATRHTLKGLAYAHSRGVLHCDVKHHNILICNGVYKLTDFGIARRHGRSWYIQAGTRAFMPPEQLFGDPHYLCAATDLFALGVMVWRLATGKLPFAGSGTLGLHHKCIGERVDFAPSFAVPRDLEDWLVCCTRPASPDRFRCAADALAALGALGPIRREQVVAQRRELEEKATVVADAERASGPSWEARSGSGGSEDSVEDGDVPPTRGLVPPAVPMDTTWGERDDASPRLLNAGVRLFSFRAFPTIGREREQEALWRCLATVRRTGDPGLVVISGAPGLGRKHLARWLGERAAETGAANLIRLSFDGETGLAGWLEAQFPHDEIEPALLAQEAFWGPLSERTYQTLRLPPTQRGVDETIESVRELILSRGRRRPTVVLWEDTDSEEPWDLVRAMEGCATPVLFVTSVAEDRASRLPDLPCTRLTLGPLPDSERVPFNRQLMGLQPELDSRLATIAQGNPGYAIRVCQHWAGLDALEPSHQGYRLVDGFAGELPVPSAWSERVDAVVAGDPRRLEALAVAALLGQHVDARIWRKAVADPTPCAALAGDLVRRTLAKRLPQGSWRFTHRGFREAILARPELDLDTLASWCADALSEAERGDPRLAWCLIRAQRWDAAAPAVLDAVWRAWTRAETHTAIDLLSQWPVVAEGMALQPSDGMNERVAILELLASQGLGEVGVMREVIDRVRALAKEHGWLEASLLCDLQEARWCMGIPGWSQRVEELVEPLSRLPMGLLHPQINLDRAQCAGYAGDYERAAALSALAMRNATTCKLATLPRYQAEYVHWLTRLGELEDATELAVDAAKLARERGLRLLEAITIGQQGDTAAYRLDFETAEHHLERAARIARRIGDAIEGHYVAMWGLTKRMGGRIEPARDLFESVLLHPTRHGQLLAKLGMLTLDLDAASWDEHFPAVEARMTRGDPDLLHGLLLTQAGDLRLELGQRLRARKAYRIALVQLDRFDFSGAAQRADELRRVLDRLA